MATIRKRGSKWEAQIRRKGHRTISRSFETKTDAKTWARQIDVGLELGSLELPERSNTDIKLGDLVDRLALRTLRVLALGCRSWSSRKAW